MAPLAAGRETLALAFRYRRGGGVVEAEAIERGLDAPQAAHTSYPDLSMTLSAAGVEAFPLRFAGMAPARALVPRERFCALAHGGATIATVDGPKGFAPVQLAAIDGAPALIAEACPE